MKLDERDQKIIEILKNNARTPVKEIAGKLGLSVSTVSLRIKNLVKKNIIKGFKTVINQALIEDACQLVLEIAADKAENINELGKALSAKENICLVLNITGEYDFLVFSKCKDSLEGAAFLNELRKLKGVSKIKSHYVLQKLKVEF
ncbi:MAG: Lrp/AsnC family transcriptional regulator [Candidatus Odinarchaeota archaeon]